MFIMAGLILLALFLKKVETCQRNNTSINQYVIYSICMTAVIVVVNFAFLAAKVFPA